MRRRRLRDSDADLRWAIFLALVPFLLGPLDDVGRAAIKDHDEECRASVGLAATSPQWTELMGWLGEFVVEHYLSPEARRQGYGMEDVIAFVDFLEQELNIA